LNPFGAIKGTEINEIRKRKIEALYDLVKVQDNRDMMVLGRRNSTSKLRNQLGPLT
jgi:hypothetical protein